MTIELNQKLSCRKAGAAPGAYVVAACDEVVDADGEVLALLKASPVLPVDHLELQDLRAAAQRAGSLSAAAAAAADCVHILHVTVHSSHSLC